MAHMLGMKCEVCLVADVVMTTQDSDGDLVNVCTACNALYYAWLHTHEVHQVHYCVRCEVVESTEALCDGCLREVVDDMHAKWDVDDMMAQVYVQQCAVDGGLY